MLRIIIIVLISEDYENAKYILTHTAVLKIRAILFGKWFLYTFPCFSNF